MAALDFKYGLKELAQQLTQAVLEKGELVLFIPGGSFPPHFQLILSAWLEKNIPLRHVTLTFTDERFTANTHDRNDSILADKVITRAEIKGLKIVPIWYSSTRRRDCALKFSTYVKEILRSNARTVAIVGVGEDGHIAGILPHKSEFSSLFTDSYVAEYKLSEISEASSPYPERITLGFKALREMDRVWLYLNSEKDEELIRRVHSLGSEQTSAEVPLLGVIDHADQVFSIID